MSYALRSLVEDDNRYLQSFQLFLECSSEHQCMQDFIHAILPDILTSIGEGKANINVMGVGSGAGESGWGKLWRTFRTQLCSTESSQCVTTGDIKTYLDSKAVSYQSYELPSQMDITECFTEGDQRGELLLDFLTEVLNFSSTAPAELKASALELLRHPDCSREVDGRVIFNNTLGVLVVDPLQ
ncbi:unnamed protein product [Coregonus sp. 'balchen']|nr:unnamed protein product [Coregonus sp. 'balchen']